MSILSTPRLNLRELVSHDASFIVELLNEPAFIRYIGDKGVRTLADAGEYLRHGPQDSYRRNGFGLYAVCLQEGTAIGICGLVKRDGLSDPDVGFAFLARYATRGYALEAVSAVLKHAHEVLKRQRIVAITSADNARSIAVLQRAGLNFERPVQLLGQGPTLQLYATTAG